MKTGLLTREQAVALVGDTAVEKVEKKNCEPTSRLCDLVEFEASIMLNDGNRLVAYYYQTKETYNTLDLDCMDWAIEGYEVV